MCTMFLLVCWGKTFSFLLPEPETSKLGLSWGPENWTVCLDRLSEWRELYHAFLSVLSYLQIGIFREGILRFTVE